MEYQYDELGRLIAAATNGAGGWGLAWTHDGFGNLTRGTLCAGPSFCLRIAAFIERSHMYNQAPEAYQWNSMNCHSMTYTGLMSTVSGYGWNIEQFRPALPSPGWGVFVPGMWY